MFAVATGLLSLSYAPALPAAHRPAVLSVRTAARQVAMLSFAGASYSGELPAFDNGAPLGLLEKDAAVVFGMLDLNYALFYGSVGIAGAIVGTKGAKALIDRTGRASFLLFFLAAVLFGSGLLMAYSGLPLILQTGLTGFRPLCGRAGAADGKSDDPREAAFWSPPASRVLV